MYRSPPFALATTFLGLLLVSNICCALLCDEDNATLPTTITEGIYNPELIAAGHMLFNSSRP